MGKLKFRVEGLKYRLNVGLTYRNSNSGYYLGTGALNYQPATLSSASIGNSLTTQWVLENMVTYDRTFGKHKINATALYSAEQTRFNSSLIAAVMCLLMLSVFQFRPCTR
ncbi:hypothetical protein EJ377_01405 [Chryseobacterium arthrosphaerae]|uniref:Outer membrane protein beta-barrel domain-containing protein n=1 Tax=Chryseobacterium arthrosphaerae TaxID=651561 RepID=A0A3S0Q706_9FLAO|nr:hypothetical protein EJ377_01405 [Chryseobacterium arthrosphaerae]